MLSTLVERLYEAKPDRLLYHYTGYPALLGIAQSGELWATDIHYFNDSSELTHAVQIFQAALTSAATAGSYPISLVTQMREWLNLRLADGHMLFIACFSEDGNLLSQWRGYTPHGNGVSLGFDSSFLVACALAQEFRLAQCIYDRDQQLQVARQSIDALLIYAQASGPASPQEAHPSQSYHPRFYSQEVNLLSIAALLKNPAFIAEREWRAVSAVSPSYVKNPPRYRAGRTTLIPYKPFSVRLTATAPMQLAHVYLGPTSENNLAMSALSTFLSSCGVSPKQGVHASQLPYRET